MTKARKLADLIDANGDVKSANLDNVPAVDLTNLNASNLTSGSIPDARVPQSAVTQHSTSFDDNKIVNDLSTLAIRQASNENKGAYNTNSMYVDVFQDGTGIASNTNAPRDDAEFVSTISSTPATEVLLHFEETSGSYTNSGIGAGSGQTLTLPTIVNSSNALAKFGNYGHNVNSSSGRSVKLTKTASPYLIPSDADFTVEFFQNNNGLPINQEYTSYWQIKEQTGSGGNLQSLQLRQNFGSENLRVYYPSGQSVDLGSANETSYRHHAYSRVNGTTSYWFDGVRKFTFSDTQVYDGISIGNYVTDVAGGQVYQQVIDDVLISTTMGKYDPTQSTITVPTSTLTPISRSIANATGSFESNAITAPSSTNKMGAIITYQDNAGTNTLNTDIVLKLSADGGSNYATATMTALPDFATGIKMAKVNDLSVTAGTSLKYKIEFANQASGSKEARIRGVSLQY